jgi:hypothetical protein
MIKDANAQLSRLTGSKPEDLVKRTKLGLHLKQLKNELNNLYNGNGSIGLGIAEANGRIPVNLS